MMTEDDLICVNCSFKSQACRKQAMTAHYCGLMKYLNSLFFFTVLSKCFEYPAHEFTCISV